MNFTDLASQKVVTNTIAALEKNGIVAEVVENKAAAKEKVSALLPKGSQVMNMTSITLDQLGLPELLNDSGTYDSVKTKLSQMDEAGQNREKAQLGAAPEWVLGSVHAITESGQVIIASNTGSQLPAYAYGSAHVVWLVSTKKIVADLEEGMRRINEHIVPLESVRARQAYGLPDSWDTFPSKLLIVNREVNPGRIHVIFVNEDLGF